MYLMSERSPVRRGRPSRWLPLLLLAGFAALGTPSAFCQTAGRERLAPALERLLARMTFAEKLGQLSMAAGGGEPTGPAVGRAAEAAVRAGRIGAFIGVHGTAETHRLQRIAVEQSRLGIPLLFAYDVIHGFRTIFPMPLAEAASWDLALAEASARAAAREATAAGLHWTFAPMVDIARDPRWGRVVEGAGEDPLLASRFAAARVRGFQGSDLAAPDTLLATAKHFVAYGAAEGGRDYDQASLAPRRLREVYLPPFRAALQAGAGALMPAFSALNGIPSHADPILLRGLLREQWGFEGVVVSDWNAIRELIAHGLAAGPAEAALRALRAGVDIDMVSGLYSGALAEAAASGRRDRRLIDEAVRRVLKTKAALGLFEEPYRYGRPGARLPPATRAGHRALARRVAADSVVLLENRGDILPLVRPPESLAVIGALADAPRDMLGGWSMAGRPAEAVTVLEGIRAAVPAHTELLYEPGVPVRELDGAGIDAAVEAARQADLTVLVAGESADMSAEANNRVSLGLPGAQLQLFDALDATGTPLIVVLVTGRPLAVPTIAAKADALLNAWFLGSEMGHAVADVLFGKVNPSARLPISVPWDVGQLPLYYSAPPSGRPAAPGRPYRLAYLDAPVRPLYPFGYGLGYTRFAYDQLALDTAVLEPDGELRVSVRVSNVGERAGREVVQLYLRDRVASVVRPRRELKDFRKVHLEAGESQQLDFVLRPADLAFPDVDLDPVAEAGAFEVYVGGSSDAALSARFTLGADWRPAPGAAGERLR